MQHYHQKAKTGIDFLQCLETDIAVYIMSFLDDASDLVRACAVSRHWRQFVIANELAKQWCLKKFPQLSNIAGTVVCSGEVKTSSTVYVERTIPERLRDREIRATKPFQRQLRRCRKLGPSKALMEVYAARDHRVYASLHHALTKSKVYSDFTSFAVFVSSTDNLPDESVQNTLHDRASYWSSKGQNNPAVPEMIIYGTSHSIKVITEIDIQPFEASNQPGKPIYSAKSVRFRIGCPNFLSGKPDMDLAGDELAGDDAWTYTSPEYPMMQENRLQTFKLPEPVLCINGFVRIELLGRVQRQETDGLFYIRLSRVRARGRRLVRAFEMVFRRKKQLVLEYNPEKLSSILEKSTRDINDDHRSWSQLEKEMAYDFLWNVQQLPNRYYTATLNDDF